MFEYQAKVVRVVDGDTVDVVVDLGFHISIRSEEHTSELQSH